jgi:hypothetical protein
MYLIISIDVEEDNWGSYDPLEYSVENLRKVPVLQEIFDRFEVTPTYLVNYPVASDPWAAKLFSRYAQLGRCEIGMHCHPWNTPPYEEIICDYNSMICNLPAELQYQKLKHLHESIIKNIGTVPVSFRAGRWGFNAATAKAIHRLGYKTDTSVTPFVSWEKSRGQDFSTFGPEPFRFSSDDIAQKVEGGPLLQVPASVGFLQTNYHLCRVLKRAAESRIGRMVHLKGILYRSGLLNQAWLSPELSDVGTMVRLARSLEKNNCPCLNLTFHSSSLKEGLSPFVGMGEEVSFLKKIEDFLRFARSSGFESITLREFEKRYSRHGVDENNQGAADRKEGFVNGRRHAVNE